MSKFAVVDRSVACGFVSLTRDILEMDEEATVQDLQVKLQDKTGVDPCHQGTIRLLGHPSELKFDTKLRDLNALVTREDAEKLRAKDESFDHKGKVFAVFGKMRW